jgi:hypothetical protein
MWPISCVVRALLIIGQLGKKCDKNSVIRQRLAKSKLSTDNKEFWFEVKRLTRQQVARDSVVAKNSIPHDTASMFAQKYSDLNGYVSYLQADMKVIESQSDVMDVMGLMMVMLCDLVKWRKLLIS